MEINCTCGYLLAYPPPHDLKNIFYLFLERRKGKEEVRKRNISVWLPLTCPQLGIWPTIQACALIGNQTGNPLVWSLHSIHWATPAMAPSTIWSIMLQKIITIPWLKKYTCQSTLKWKTKLKKNIVHKVDGKFQLAVILI